MKLFGFKNFDELLAYNCAPVLTGIKPANLICLHPDDPAEIPRLIAEYNAQFQKQGIVFQSFETTGSRFLLLIYKPDALESILRQAGYQAYLIASGYETGCTLQNALTTLALHLKTQKSFPHEIGVFLGYPLEDILGFALNKGKNCKYSGYWKVYGDVDKARQIFAAYETCRNMVLTRLANGLSLTAAIATA